MIDEIKTKKVYLEWYDDAIDDIIDSIGKNATEDDIFKEYLKDQFDLLGDDEMKTYIL